MSEVCSSWPALTPRIKVWLKNNCRLIEFNGPEGALAKGTEKHNREVALSGGE